MTRLLLCAAGMLLLVCAAAGPAAAAFSAVTANGTNSLRADTLAPPTAPAVSQACVTDPMPVQRANGSSFTSGNNSGTLTVARPSGAQVGDVLLASIVWGGGTITDASGGWTPIFNPQLADSGIAQSVYYRVVTATEPSSYSWNGSTGAAAGGIAAYSGVDKVAPVNASSGQISSDKVAPSLTTTRANVRLIGLWALIAGLSPTVPSGMTQIWNGVSSGNGGSTLQVTAVAADEPWPTPGPTGTRALANGGGGRAVNQLVALQPPSWPHATTTWTLSASAYATGQVYRRSSGGTVQRQATVSATVTGQTDGPLVSGTGYTVDVAATFAGWTSTRATVTFTAITC